ncbi:hypothetical protein D3C73_1563650 [compost metagenome]
MKQLVDFALALLEFGYERDAVDLILQVADFSLDLLHHSLVAEALEGDDLLLLLLDLGDQPLHTGMILNLLLGLLKMPHFFTS